MITETEATATSAPDPLHAAGRLEREAARARTERLFLEHARMVDGLCRGLLRDKVEAEDAAQQTFLSAYRALLRGGEPREPAAWLAAIARNECLGRIRERMRQPLPAYDAEPASVAADPLAESLHRADLAALWAAISALAPQQREALLLREFGGLSYEELGVALGVSVPAVESLLFRARTRLRTELKAALAAVNGAGWISVLRDLLPQLFGAGGAAKVAAATVGAGVLAGGAIVGEHTLVHPARPSHRPVAAGAARAAPAVSVAAAVVAAPLANATRTATDLRVARHPRRHGEQRPPTFAVTGHDGERGDDGHDGSRHRDAATTSGEDGGVQGESSGNGGGGGTAPQTVTDTSGSDSGSGSGGSESGDGGDGGSDHGGDGGLTLPVTVTTPSTPSGVEH